MTSGVCAWLPASCHHMLGRVCSIFLVCACEVFGAVRFIFVFAMAKYIMIVYFQNRNPSFKTLLLFTLALAWVAHRNIWIQMSDLVLRMYGLFYSQKQNSFCVCISGSNLEESLNLGKNPTHKVTKSCLQ